jgi:hypothetical protein
MAAIVGQLSGGWQAEKTGRIGFTPGLGPGKGAADESKGFISRTELLAYHPKTGR